MKDLIKFLEAVILDVYDSRIITRDFEDNYTEVIGRILHKQVLPFHVHKCKSGLISFILGEHNDVIFKVNSRDLESLEESLKIQLDVLKTLYGENDYNRLPLYDLNNHLLEQGFKLYSLVSWSISWYSSDLNVEILALTYPENETVYNVLVSGIKQNAEKIVDAEEVKSYLSKI